MENMKDWKAENIADLKNTEDKKIKNMEDLKAADNFQRNNIIYHSTDTGCIYYHYPPDPKFKSQLFPLQASNPAGCESF